MLVSIPLMIILSKNMWSINFIVTNFTQLFTSQSTLFTETKIFVLSLPRLNRITLIILICIWLQSASILTKAFTGLLLNTYSNILYIPCADSFEQIYQDQTLDVYSADRIKLRYDYLKNNLKINPKIIDNIIEREYNTQNKYKFFRGAMSFKVDTLEKILTCKLIVICPTNFREIFETKLINWRSMLSVSKNKYMNNLKFLIVPKNIVQATLFNVSCHLFNLVEDLLDNLTFLVINK